MTEMQIEQSDDRAYFTDARGVKWRVHDASFGTPYAQPHHYHRCATEDRRATSRVFVSAEGSRRSYAFARAKSRELSVAQCARQLEHASFLASSAFDPHKFRPGTP